MSNTWNFPCYRYIDESTKTVIASPRNTSGTFFYLGSPDITTFPFTDQITLFFSFLVRSGGWSSETDLQGIMSLSKASASDVSIQIYLSQTPYRLVVKFSDDVGNVLRYHVELGDEDGVNWIQTDKWYQVGTSVNASRIQFVVNGSTTPKNGGIAGTPGVLNMDSAARLWVGNRRADHGHTPGFGLTDFSPVTDGWSTLLFGPMMAHSTAIDLADATVRARIWDENGDWKNPGEDGSYWYGDIYSAIQPFNYLLNGSGNRDNGTSGQTWQYGTRGLWFGFPAGMKKQYGTAIPA